MLRTNQTTSPRSYKEEGRPPEPGVLLGRKKPAAGNTRTTQDHVTGYRGYKLKPVKQDGYRGYKLKPVKPRTGEKDLLAYKGWIPQCI